MSSRLIVFQHHFNHINPKTYIQTLRMILQPRIIMRRAGSGSYKSNISTVFSVRCSAMGRADVAAGDGALQTCRERGE